ncbi:DUF2254 domain-containing protein [Metabacillus litoralis]|uniref:DUF2254 domain-containing protein n=1 Tax=Metabacillus litoralis TaxID=152268 RepID=UPI001CFF44EE|nr:DUF2254 domain-containing protein [Metabacillus litoralis]
MFNKLFLFVKSRVWLLPTLFSIVAFFLAALVSFLDQFSFLHNTTILKEYLSINSDLAKTILSTIAGSLLTMTTITFSTIMVVLTTYSSQFSPRTLQNFIRDRVTMRVLGIFIGGFVYSIFSLLFMKEKSESYVLAATSSVVIASICVGIFAYFIHHVASSVRVSKLIEKLTDDVRKTIHMQKRKIENNEGISIVKNVPLHNQYSKTLEIKNKDIIGYIQLIDEETLCKNACEEDYFIEIHHQIGSFLSLDKKVITIHYNGEIGEKGLEEITLGNERTTMQDVDFGLQQLTEIALRAISPGINDPNTAIDCIRHLSLCLKEVSKLDGSFMAYYDEKRPVLCIPQRPFEDIVRSSFYQICHYGQKDISILVAIFDALLEISECNTETIITKSVEFSEYILEKIDINSFPEIDQQLLKKKKSHLEAFLK